MGNLKPDVNPAHVTHSSVKTCVSPSSTRRTAQESRGRRSAWVWSGWPRNRPRIPRKDKWFPSSPKCLHWDRLCRMLILTPFLRVQGGRSVKLTTYLEVPWLRTRGVRSPFWHPQTPLQILYIEFSVGSFMLWRTRPKQGPVWAKQTRENSVPVLRVEPWLSRRPESYTA
jgi:hypothetical protein